MNNFKIVERRHLTPHTTLIVGAWQDSEAQTYIELRHWLNSGVNEEPAFTHINIPINHLQETIVAMQQIQEKLRVQMGEVLR